MEEKKGLIAEFKEFLLQGNVIDLAVGVVIGGAFRAIIDSLVADIIMPVISLVTGGVDFNNWFIALDGGKYATLEEAEAAGAATLRYGTFLGQILTFIIVALCIFLLVKGINKMRKAKEEEVTTKICPFCQSEIALDATRCPHCTSQL